jgi:hypothetical protein
MVINDSQEFFQSGKLSVFLSQKISDAKALNAGASDEEALDMLLNEAESLLK